MVRPDSLLPAVFPQGATLKSRAKKAPEAAPRYLIGRFMMDYPLVILKELVSVWCAVRSAQLPAIGHDRLLLCELVRLQGDLEFMRWFDGLFRSGVNWSFHARVF